MGIQKNQSANRYTIVWTQAKTPKYWKKTEKRKKHNIGEQRKKERRKDEKLTSSDTSTTPLMMFFPLRATTCTRNIFPRNPKPPKSLATRTDPTGQNKNLNSVALAQTLNPSALLAKKFSGHS
jgi:hypothetical protein